MDQLFLVMGASRLDKRVGHEMDQLLDQLFLVMGASRLDKRVGHEMCQQQHHTTFAVTISDHVRMSCAVPW